MSTRTNKPAESISPAPEFKTCLKCGENLPLECFGLRANQYRLAQCKKCRQVKAREYRKSRTEPMKKTGLPRPQFSIEKSRENKRRYHKRHADRLSEVRKQKYQRDLDRELNYSRQYYKENNAVLLRSKRVRDALKSAIESGKSSPICRRHGFSIARNPLGEYRAARSDYRLERGESPVACYVYNGESWEVFAPDVFVAGAEKITDWCRRYEVRQAKKAVTNA